MGEALISRAGGGAGDSEQIIPIVPGYHTILATLLTSDNRAITNHMISCKDGSTYYNYNTNEKGQCMFTYNSGSANMFVNTTINGINYIDINNTWVNVAAPIGVSQRVNIYFDKRSGNIDIGSGSFHIFQKCKANIIIEGGGGGGSGTVYGGANTTGGGGGGGSGGGHGSWASPASYYGGSGGTSYIQNTNMSAIGGGGGRCAPDAAGAGGAGYRSGSAGASRSWNSGGSGGASYFASGGSGCIFITDWEDGYTYVNDTQSRRSQAGSKGSGGGGGAASSESEYSDGARGGSGWMRISFL